MSMVWNVCICGVFQASHYNQPIPIQGVREAVAIDFHFKDSRIYMTDIRSEVSAHDVFAYIMLHYVYKFDLLLSFTIKSFNKRTLPHIRFAILWMNKVVQ
jgi:hypothetical protein